MALPFAKYAALIAALGFLALTGCTRPGPEKELRLFTWSEYFEADELRAFERATGTKVKVDYYSSNEEMLTKIQLTADGAGYDLVIPSDYMVRTMIELKLLRPIDRAKLSFLKDFPAAARNPPYDPGLSYSVPLAAGLTGVAWNTKLLPKLPNGENFSWKDFFEAPETAGETTVLDDTREVLQAALLVAGKDLASASAADVRAAFDYLTARKGQLKGFTSETRSVIVAGECVLCMAYSGDVLAVTREKPEVRFIQPAGGLTTWTDNFAIPKNARNPEGAYAFMRQVLSPEGAAAFTERTRNRTFQEKARALLPPELAQSSIIFPQGNPESYHYLVNRKELADLVDRSWALLKSH